MQSKISAHGLLHRLKTGTRARSDTELARMLGVSQQSISSARSNNKVPDSWIRNAAERYTLSADWLLFGVGSPMRTEMSLGSYPVQDFAPEAEEVFPSTHIAKQEQRIRELEQKLAEAQEEALKAYKLVVESMRSAPE